MSKFFFLTNISLKRQSFTHKKILRQVYNIYTDYLSLDKNERYGILEFEGNNLNFD